MQYLNFDLLVDKWQEQYKARVVNSPSGEASCVFDLPFTHQEVQKFLASGKAKEMGSKLFAAVFANKVGSCWDKSILQTSQSGKGLRLRLRLADVPELAALPWEYLYSPSEKRFLSLSTQTPIVRYLGLTQTVSSLNVQLPLRILVMIANPYDAPPLDGEQEWQRLQKALLPLEEQGLIKLERLPKGTYNALQRQLRKQNYHIFHFIGHGIFDSLTQKSGILLENDHRKSHFVSAEKLGTLLHDHGSLRLVLLNACEGARASLADSFGGTAQYLVQQGIPAVMAMQLPIQDKSAIAFASEFYAALADGYPVDAALSEGRKLLTQKHHLAWGIPVLYMRSPDGQLFEVKKDLEREILIALYKRFESDSSSPKMTFTELYQAIKVFLHDEKQLSAVHLQLFSLQRYGWIQFQLVADDRLGLAEITPKGRQVAQERYPLIAASAPTLASNEGQRDDEKLKNDPDREVRPPATLADLVQREPDCADILQRQSLMQEIINSFEQKVNRMHFVVLYAQGTIERRDLLRRLCERLESKYLPLMLMGLGTRVRTSDLDAFLFDFATQVAKSFNKWGIPHQLSMLERPRWEEFNQRGVVGFETFWSNLQQIAQPRHPLLILDKIEKLLDRAEVLDSQILTFLDEFITDSDNGCFIFAGSERMLHSKNHQFAELIDNGKLIPVNHHDDETVLRIFSFLEKYMTYEKQVLQDCLTLCDGHPRILPVLIEMMLSLTSKLPRTKRVERKDFNRMINMTIGRISQTLSLLQQRLSKQEHFVLQLIRLRIPNPIKPSEIHLDELVTLAERQFPRANVNNKLIRQGVVELAKREWVEWKDLNYNLFRFKLGIFLLWLRRDQIMFEEVMP